MKYKKSASDYQEKLKKHLLFLMQSDSASKQQALANPVVDPMLLELLCSDHDETIILQAAQHPNHNEHSLERLAQHSNTLVRQAVAQHSHSTSHIWLLLLEDQDNNVVKLACQGILQSDDSIAKLKLLRQHAHYLERDSLEKLRLDADGRVRLYAHQRLQQHYRHSLEVLLSLQAGEQLGEPTTVASPFVPISLTSAEEKLEPSSHKPPSSHEDLSSHEDYGYIGDIPSYFETERDSTLNETMQADSDNYIALLTLQDTVPLLPAEPENITKLLLRSKALEDERLQSTAQALSQDISIFLKDERLASILEYRKASSIRNAYRALTEQGYILTVDDILVAAMIKDIWDNHKNYGVMSWKFGLKLSHAFTTIPAWENLHIFFAEHYSYWRARATTRASHHFSYYLRHLLRAYPHNIELIPLPFLHYSYYSYYS